MVWSINMVCLMHRKTTTYPYGMENYVILVPSIKKQKYLIIDFIIGSPLINVWAITIVLFLSIRIVIRKLTHTMIYTNVSALFLNTFGHSFGVADVLVTRSRSERILMFFLSLFALLSGILLSGSLFEHLTNVSDEFTINTIDDLCNDPNIDIIMPLSFNMSHYKDYIE